MGKPITKKCHAAMRRPWYRSVASLLAVTAITAFSATSASAQISLYNNLVTQSLDSRNNAPAYLNTGGNAPFQFVVQSTRDDNGNTVNTLVTQMLSEELYLKGNSLADVIVRSLAVSITNSNVGLGMTIRPHIRIYDDNHPTPTPPYPPPVPPNPPFNDSPGTLLKTVDLGDFFVPGATDNATRPIAGSAILNVDSVQFGALNLPMTGTKYWFGIFFDVDIVDGVPLATQIDRLRRIGQGLYNPPTVGFSGDVHHETDLFGTGDQDGDGDNDGFPNYQRNYFNTSFANTDPNGTYVQTFGMTDPNGQPVPSNFGWLINGFIVPEPSAAAFALLGIPAFAFVVRRRKP